jgi:TRAP-type C4-dicarboxylate transport system permease small subunit
MSAPPAPKAARLLEPFLFATLAVMVVLVFCNVVLRAVFGGALTWADEVARMLFIWLTFVGASVGVVRGSHIGMDIVVQMVSPRVQRRMEILSTLLILLFLGVWGLYGLRLVVQNVDYLAPATGVPMGYVYLAGPVGAALMAATYVGRLFRLLTHRQA